MGRQRVDAMEHPLGDMPAVVVVPHEEGPGRLQGEGGGAPERATR